MNLSRFPFLIVVALLLVSGMASAHAPQFSEGNTSLDTATVIEDTVKSWAIYSHMGSEEVLYFTFQIDEGDRLRMDLIIPVEDGDAGFLPGYALMAPGMASEGALPAWVEVPAGYGYQVVNTSLPEEATYEGFTPSAFYDLGRTDAPAPVTGTYYVVVFTPYAQEGHFALVVGYDETFTIQEYLLMPFSLYQVHLWEGQEYWQILAPMVVTILFGGVAMFYYRNRLALNLNLRQALMLTGGLLILGSGVGTLVQTVVKVMDSRIGLEVLISVIFFLVPLWLGYVTVRRGWNVIPLTRKGRAKTVLCGLLAVLVWAGFLIGPVMVIAAALLPKPPASRARRWGGVRFVRLSQDDQARDIEVRSKGRRF